jgi:hypothetical protein
VLMCIKSIICSQHRIPPPQRSPGLNPTDNVTHNLKNESHGNALRAFCLCLQMARIDPKCYIQKI